MAAAASEAIKGFPECSCPNHDLDKRMERVKKELEEHGVAVLPGVINEETCDDFVTQLHTWLAKFGNNFPVNVSSVIHRYNIAHHPVAWNVRLHAAQVFKSLWETEKLVTSIDGMAIGEPPELNHEKFSDGTRGLHLDQGEKRKGLHAYQGAVYLEAAEEDDWCFLVMDKSHLYHDEYFSQREGPKPRSEFLKLQKDVQWYLDKGCVIRRIPVPKGGMVLWDSRLVHAGARPLKGRKNPGRWRYVVFACMAPAKWATEKDMERKREGLQKLQCSRHWPANGFSCFFSRHDDGDLNAVTELPEVALGNEAKLLAGELYYDFKDGKPNGPPAPQTL